MSKPMIAARVWPLAEKALAIVRRIEKPVDVPGNLTLFAALQVEMLMDLGKRSYGGFTRSKTRGSAELRRQALQNASSCADTRAGILLNSRLLKSATYAGFGMAVPVVGISQAITCDVKQ